MTSFKVVAHCGIAVQIDRTRRLEKPLYLQEACSQVNEIGLVAWGHGSEQDSVQHRVLGFNQVDPLDIYIGERVNLSLNAAPAALEPMGAE